MESIKLIAAQIIDTDRMKQSGRFRVTFELTENDAKSFCGLLAVAENNELLADITLEFTEVQGNNNGFEKSVVQEPKKEKTIYQIFKDKCIEYSGENYYNRLKKHLKIDHMKDLEQKHSESMIKDLLNVQERYIYWRSRGYNHEASDCSASNPDVLTHKDNALNLWHELFNDFNNSQNEERNL